MLKPQDIAILVTVMIIDSEWTYREIADKLDMSPSSVHDGLARADLCNLFNKDKRRVLRRNLLEFLVHGIQYAFPVPPKPVSRGILTGYAVPPLSDRIQHEEDVPPVWPYAQGTELGQAIKPLHPSVPRIAQEDKSFYEVFSLIEALRNGRTREKTIAADLLREYILS